MPVHSTALLICRNNCGKQSPPHKYSGKPTYCTQCTLERRRARGRAVMEKKARAAGVQKTKGTFIKCGRCDAEFMRGGVHTKYCTPCRPEVSRQAARDRVSRLSRERGAKEIGSKQNCKHCGVSFKMRSSCNSCCADCSALTLATALPHQRDASRNYRREWSTKNPEKTRKYGYESRQRRKKNPAFVLNERMSAGIRGSLTKGSKAGAKWETLAGYSVNDLVEHLERQFTGKMGWHNIGEWHIDHIVPKSSFDYTSADDDSFKRCWSLANLRPLWATDNIRKSARQTHLI